MNLTITVDADVLKRARIRATGEGTSVNAVLCDHLAVYADSGRSPREAAAEASELRRDAVESLIRLSRIPRPEAAPARTSRDEYGNRTWKRDDLHDR